MKTISISTNYNLIWQIKGYENYKVSEKGIVINCQTNRVLKRVVNCSSVGYWFNKKFITLDRLRPLLEKIQYSECPF
jgi:hypothetical protein